MKEKKIEEFEPTIPRDVVLYFAVSSLPCSETKLHVESHVM